MRRGDEDWYPDRNPSDGRPHSEFAASNRSDDSAAQSLTDPELSRSRWFLEDIAIVVGLSLAAAIASYFAFPWCQSLCLEESRFNSYFNADTSLVYSNMVTREGSHYRNNIHPIFSLVGLGATRAVGAVTGADAFEQVRLVIAGVSGLATALSYILLRIMLGRSLDALIFTSLGISSAASLFFFTVPETFSFGFLSIATSYLLVLLAERRKVPRFWFVINGVLAFGFTITNGMFAIATNLVTQRLTRAVLLLVSSGVLLLIVFSVQKLILIPSSGWVGDLRGEVKFMHAPDPGLVAEVLVEPVVIPETQLSIKSVESEGSEESIPWVEIERNRGLGVFPDRGLRLLAVLIWITILAVGLISWAVELVRKTERRPFRIALGLTFFGQLVLHSLYGGQPMLYSAHLLLPLILMAAMTCTTPLRPLALVFAVILTPLLAACNGGEFLRVTDHLRSSPSVSSTTTPGEGLEASDIEP